MKCWHCDTELIWGGDHSYADYGMDSEGIVSNLSCPNCEAYVEVYIDFNKKKELLAESRRH
jgi:hypothetical protein